MQSFNKYLRGFSLIETIIAIAILGVIGAFSVSVLLKSFQGGEKSQTISMIKQNGQNSLDIIDHTVRSSKRIICVGEYAEDQTMKTLTVYNNEGYIRFVIKPETANNNGYIAKDTLTVIDPNKIVTACSADDPTVYAVGANSRIFLTNQELTTGVSVQDGKFEVSYTVDRAAVVTVYFKLGPPYSAQDNNTASSIEEFKTTVKLFEK